jgi:NADPH:quinone reductase-like Zn-dependent oxidoreductase
MSKAIRIHRFGGPEVLELVDLPVADPGPGQVRIAHEVIGLNMIDTYCRTGLYPLELPSGLGSEAAGRVTHTGSGVTNFRPGMRVAYAAPAPFDAYSEERLIDARWLVALPDAIDSARAAAIMLKGMTSWYLLHRSYHVAAGDWLLVLAAAGGVGSLLVPWAAALGANVIGVVGTEAKAARAQANGAGHVLCGYDNLSARVRAITRGKGVAAVYDSVGRDSFMHSLDCLAPHGVMVSYGNSSGPVDPIAPLELMRRGSLYLTRPTVFDFIGERTELEAASSALFARIAAGDLDVQVNQRYRLADVAEAHRALEARQTTGATVLEPGQA